MSSVNIAVVEKLESFGFDRELLEIDTLESHGTWNAPRENILIINYDHEWGFLEKLFSEESIKEVSTIEDFYGTEIIFNLDLEGWDHW